MQSLLRQCQRFKKMSKELRCNEIISEAHVFMSQFAKFKHHQSKKPIRTVKTILHTLCETMGEKVSALNEIAN